MYLSSNRRLLLFDPLAELLRGLSYISINVFRRVLPNEVLTA
jgi:hypothetical protein